MATPTRVITQEDILKAENLRRYWDAAKRNGLRQKDATVRLNKAQSTIADYLRCRIALNDRAIMQFVGLLNDYGIECAPKDIDPSLAEYNLLGGTVQILGTLERNRPEKTSLIVKRTSVLENSTYGIEVDTDAYREFCKKGDVLIVTPAAPIRARQRALLQTKAQYIPVLINKFDNTDLHYSELGTMQDYSLPTKKVLTLHKLAGIEYH